MTKQEMHIAALESMGWKHLEGLPRDPNRMSWYRDETSHALQCLPPLTLDLMHEVTSTLTEDEGITFMAMLWDIVKPSSFQTGPRGWYVCQFKVDRATAEQRAEALLRTKGLWKE